MNKILKASTKILKFCPFDCVESVDSDNILMLVQKGKFIYLFGF